MPARWPTLRFLLLIFLPCRHHHEHGHRYSACPAPWVDNPYGRCASHQERNLMQVKVNQYDQIQVQGQAGAPVAGEGPRKVLS